MFIDGGYVLKKLYQTCNQNRNPTIFLFLRYQICMTAKIFHIVLAISVLFSTTGILLGKHICKKEMQTMDLMVDSNSNCKNTCGPNSCEKDCCSSEFQYFETDQEKYLQIIDLPSLNKPGLLAAVFLVFKIEPPSLDNNTLHYQTYRPPIVHRDISVLFQSFLI